MKKIFLHSALLVLLILGINCKGRKEPDSIMNPCNSADGFFKNGEHYIPAEFVKEDGTLNKKYKFSRKKRQHTECYPGNARIKSYRKRIPTDK